jgi:hypothetical protein
MRSRKRRKTNSENMKRLKANAEFEARRLAGIAKAKADPEQKASRRTTLAKTLAAPGVRKRAIRNSRKTQSSPEFRAGARARGKKVWSDLRSGAPAPAAKNSPGRRRKRKRKPLEQTAEVRRSLAIEQRLGSGPRTTKALVAARHAVHEEEVRRATLLGKKGIEYDTIAKQHERFLRRRHPDHSDASAGTN